MRAFVSAAGFLAVVALAGCGGDEEEESPPPSGTPVKTVQMAETEFKLQPANVTLDRAGLYTFRVVNNGSTVHALEIEGGGIEEETENIPPGGRAQVKVELKKGTYEMYCPIDDHKEKGMKGSIVVGGGAAGGATTGDDDSGGYGGG